MEDSGKLVIGRKKAQADPGAILHNQRWWR
jgi:hypothetical protein